MRALASVVASLVLVSSGCSVDPVSVGAERDWELCETNGCSALLLGIQFVDEECGVAVGGTTERGASVILRSVDRGATWAPARVSATGRLYAVDFPSRKQGYAVGFGVMLATRDGGLSWESLDPLQDRWLASVDFPSETTGFVVGGDGDKPVFWMTTDAGRSWRSIVDRMPESGRASLRDVRFFSETRGFVLGDGGLILETRDGGRTWGRIESGVTSWLRSIHLVGDAGFIASSETLLKSGDRGRTWKPIQSLGRRKLNDVIFTDLRRGWISDFGGEVLATSNGGESWQTVLGNLDTPTSFCLLAPDRLFLVTDGGHIYRRRVG